MNYVVIEDLLNFAPKMIPFRTFWFWETFNSMWNSAATHIYHEELRELFGRVHASWGEIVDHGELYQTTNNCDAIWAGDHWAPNENTAVWETIMTALRELKVATHQTLALIRKEFVTVDIEAQAAESMRDWRNQEAELRKALDEE